MSPAMSGPSSVCVSAPSTAPGTQEALSNVKEDVRGGSPRRTQPWLGSLSLGLQGRKDPEWEEGRRVSEGTVTD